MRTIETTAVVTAEHTITVKLPDDIPPGEVQVVVVVANGKPTETKLPSWKDWKPHQVGLVDPNFTFRREDLYDDNF